MKIATMGSGNMARSLGMRWAERGHEVFFGARDPQRALDTASFVQLGTRGGSVAEALAFGDVILHTARDALLSDYIDDPAHVAGKTVIELNNNPIPAGHRFEPVVQSFAERLQADMPAVKVVKAFNLFAQEVFEHDAQTLTAHDVSLFMAGDDADAKTITARLGAELGLSPVDAGPLLNTRLIESMGDLIRYLIGAQGLGPFVTLSAHTLPVPTQQRLGGRQASRLN